MGENKKIKYKMKVVKYEKRIRYEKEMREAYERYEIYAKNYKPQKRSRKNYVQDENAKREFENKILGTKHKKLEKCNDGAYKIYAYTGNGISKAPKFENERTVYKLENKIEYRRKIIMLDKNGKIKNMFVGNYATNGIRAYVEKDGEYIKCYDAYGKIEDNEKIYDIRKLKEKGIKVVREI